MKLNQEQSKHLATSLRAYGIGQLAAFGYVGIQVSDWYSVIISAIISLSLELGALFFLNGVKQ